MIRQLWYSTRFDSSAFIFNRNFRDKASKTDPKHNLREMNTNKFGQTSYTLNLKWFLRSKYIDFTASFGIGWNIAEECLDLHNDACTPRVICAKGEVGHQIKQRDRSKMRYEKCNILWEMLVRWNLLWNYKVWKLEGRHIFPSNDNVIL